MMQLPGSIRSAETDERAHMERSEQDGQLWAEPLERRAEVALRRGVTAYGSTQAPDGSWHGDYGGPLFLLPGLVIACSVTGTELSDYRRRRMVDYLSNVQNSDGGFGLHIESPSYVLGTALNYVALRLLGVVRDDPRCQQARAWLLQHGGAAGVPSWGRFWLAVLGVYSWEGVNPVPPELWLLPPESPIHPSRFWCHTRAVYLPVSYLYGRRASGPETEIVRQLRAEIFTERWESLGWSAMRAKTARTDTCRSPSAAVKVANRLMALYEKVGNRRLRKRALDFVMDHIHHEDETTGYLDIGPVSKAFNLVACWFEDPEGEHYSKHVQRIDDYLWDGYDGMKMQGYNSSQLWDTALSLQMLAEANLSGSDALVSKALSFVDANQVRDDVPEGAKYFRDSIRGAWPFSTAEQAWPVTDCTGEALEAVLTWRELGDEVANGIDPARLRQAVSFILSYQNDNGGWAPYEKARAGEWLEWLNPAEVFGKIMIDYSYVECTASCIQGLLRFSRAFPTYHSEEIHAAVARGVRYLKAEQRSDGGFIGRWGVCFTYGTWFAIKGLLAAGERPDCPEIRKACDFLVSHQRDDGGWGESYRACVEERWVEHRTAQVVNTAWACLALMAAGDSRRHVIESGIELLIGRQREAGDWAQEGISGVFNRSCMIHYDVYRNVMPLWALARYRNHVAQEVTEV